MQLFGQISIEENPLEEEEWPTLHRNNNFQNFFYALLVLFRSVKKLLILCKKD